MADHEFGKSMAQGFGVLFFVMAFVVVAIVGLFALSFATSPGRDDDRFEPVIVSDEPSFEDQEIVEDQEVVEDPEVEEDPDPFSEPQDFGLDNAAVDFDDMPTPTLEARLADLGDDRLREIEFFLPEGHGPVEFAIRNPEPIRIDGQGIAVRTDDFAQILRSSRSFAVDRPSECYDGNCRLFMWLTMGPTFLDVHPDAELLIWAGEGAAVTIEPMPVENFRDETFR